MIEPKIWDEQRTFNALLRPELIEDEVAVTEFLRDMIMNMYSEGDELLRTTVWKKHRRKRGHRPNREHRLEELVDIYKIWLTMVQTLGYSTSEVELAFWRKSMVVRQRHSEEFVKELDRPAVVVDIDGVLCDYTTGFCNWVSHRAPLFAKRAQEIIDARLIFGRASDFGMTEIEWEGFKHEFRSRGHKRYMPTMPGAALFLAELRRAGYYIILLTSRPIDRYPNVFTDTLYWLDDHNLIYDWVWWATDKKECLIENKAVKWIAFAVDDDPRYVEQFDRLGIKTYWMRTTNGHNSRLTESDYLKIQSAINPVDRLSEIPIPPVTNSMKGDI